MVRSIAVLFTVLFALYLGVHYLAAPKPVDPLPPLVAAIGMRPEYSVPAPRFTDGLISCPGPLVETAGLPIPATPALESRLYAALRKIARYRQFVKTAVHPAYVIDAQNERHFVAALGVDANSKFERVYTLRVWKSGRVDHLEPKDNSWVPLVSR